MSDRPYDIEMGHFGMWIRYDNGLFEIMADDFYNGKRHNYVVPMYGNDHRRIADLLAGIAANMLADAPDGERCDACGSAAVFEDGEWWCKNEQCGMRSWIRNEPESP